MPHPKYLETVTNALDNKIKNLEPAFRKRIFDYLITLQNITNIANCKEIVYEKFMPKTQLSKKSKKYWLDRRYDVLVIWESDFKKPKRK